MPNPPATPPQPSRRRDFFARAVREALAPVSNFLDRKISPLLQSLADLPDPPSHPPAALDQPHAPAGGRNSPNLHLPQRPPTPARTLMPPGAASPGQFEQLCSRSAACVKACPADAIKIDPQGLIAGGNPYIVAADQPCVVCDSLACMHACPTGALKLVAIANIHMGTAKVNHNLCLRTRGEDCQLCIQACPLGPVAIIISPTTFKVRVRPQGCIGCGLCESRFPTEPRAITITPWTPSVDPLIA